MSKFFSNKVFIVPGAKRPFHALKDAIYYCEDNGIDKSTIDKFDSNAEYKRYKELQMLEQVGAIRDLQRQVVFEIIPEHSHDEVVRWKDKVLWKVSSDRSISMLNFGTKKAADEYIKHTRETSSVLNEKFTVEKTTESMPVYKKVVDESKAVYTADFTYYDNEGKYIVEDVKSDYTRKEVDYILRRKLMLHVHGIKIYEYVG